MQKRVTFVIFERMEGLLDAYAPWFRAANWVFVLDWFHCFICSEIFISIIDNYYICAT